MTLAEFVRSRPADMPVKQVVAEAAAMGMKLRPGHVHSVRSYDRVRAKGGADAVKKKKGWIDPASVNGRVLSFVGKFLAENGRGPDRKEIAEALDMGPEQCSQALCFLRDARALTYPLRDTSKVRMLGPGSRATRPPRPTPSTTTPRSKNGAAHVPTLAGLLGQPAGGALEYLTRLQADLEAKLAAVRNLIQLLG